MITLGQIRGQDRAVAHLRRAIEQGRVAHAYLFTGPEGSGKHTAALAFAAALNCLTHPGQGCGGECSACSKIADGIHPDVRTLERQGAARIIPIQTIRAEILATVGMPPHEARARFFLIEEAGSMQGPAANALLKTLEEPPERTHFILGTTAPEKLLPTIRSRCQRVAFQELPADLRAELRGDDEAGARLAELADQLEAVTLGEGDLHAVAAEANRDKGNVADVLSLFASRLHRAAVEAASNGDQQRAAILSAQARAIGETEVAVQTHNAHGQLALEDLLYRLRTALP